MSFHAIAQVLLAASEGAPAGLVLKATLVMLVALLLIRLSRSAAHRHLITASAFGVLLLLPPAALLFPARAITVDVLRQPAAAGPSVRSGTLGAVTVTEGGGAPLDTAAARMEGPGALSAALGIYVLGALWLVTSLLVGIARVRRVRDRADVSVAGTRLANEMARGQRLRAGIEVAVSSELAVPLTFGWARPVILLPAETADWDEPAMGRAIRHELEHVARGDWATQIASRLALALYWPHPFAWLLWRQLRLEAERACDDAVVRTHGQAENYAEQLVALAQRLRGRGTVPALSMATRSNLGLRVEAILDARRRRAPRSRLASVVVGAAAVAGALAIAPFQVMGAAGSPPAGGERHEVEAPSLDVALLEAAEEGALETMRRLLDQGARADAVVVGDGSPLIAAARRGRLQAMQMLIAAGADVNRGVGGDGSPLIMAAKGGHLEAVRMLLERGADIDRGVRGDGNPLIMAAGAGQLEVVRFLLDRGASLARIVADDENALIRASEGGQVDVVRLLIERGADVNARVWAEARAGGEWRTPLVMARRNGHEEVIRILRAAGARR